jgi:hypothetical protein
MSLIAADIVLCGETWVLMLKEPHWCWQFLLLPHIGYVTFWI